MIKVENYFVIFFDILYTMEMEISEFDHTL